jgi:hypothetical protein
MVAKEGTKEGTKEGKATSARTNFELELIPPLPRSSPHFRVEIRR